eukprot:1157328-Pelagomonas_calceolata.AAC.10
MALLLSWLQFGNPHSRTHYYGWESEEAMETARAEVRVCKGVEGFIRKALLGSLPPGNLADDRAEEGPAVAPQAREQPKQHYAPQSRVVAFGAACGVSPPSQAARLCVHFGPMCREQVCGAAWSNVQRTGLWCREQVRGASWSNVQRTGLWCREQVCGASWSKAQRADDRTVVPRRPVKQENGAGKIRGLVQVQVPSTLVLGAENQKRGVEKVKIGAGHIWGASWSMV